MENHQLFVISIAWSDYQLQEKEKRSNQYLGAVLVCFDLIYGLVVEPSAHHSRLVTNLFNELQGCIWIMWFPPYCWN